MSIPTAHLSLFKADWIGDPDRLKALARHHKYNDLFTAELAAWCAESQLRQQVRCEPWGWRARCLRLALAAECINADDGWTIWQQALATAALVPTSKAKRFKNTLAELANMDARSLPLELHDFVWEVLSNRTTPLAERVANAYTTLSSA